MEHMDGIYPKRRNSKFSKRRKVRVVHLLSGREGGGITKAVLSLIKNFNSHIIESSMLLLSRNDLLRDVSSQGYQCHVIKKRFRGSLIVVLRIILYCLKHDIDILHTHSISSNFYGRLAGILMKNTTVITTVHARTLDELRGSFRNRILALCIHRIDLWMHRFSNQLIAVSYSLRDSLISRGVPENNIQAIPHGIDCDELDVGEEEIEAARLALKVRSNEKIVGIVGRLTHVKNHELFLRAAKIVSTGHPNCRFVIVGDGPLRKDLKDFARDLSISDKTIFTGWVDRIVPVLHLMDILVIASRSEGFGYVVLEGMACSRAIVSTGVSEIPRIISDGKTGLLVPPDDPKALAQAIDGLLRSPQWRKEMGELAREAVAERFRLDSEIERTKELYIMTLASQNVFGSPK